MGERHMEAESVSVAHGGGNCVAVSRGGVYVWGPRANDAGGPQLTPRRFLSAALGDARVVAATASSASIVLVT
jgi:hypothetical protein